MKWGTSNTIEGESYINIVYNQPLPQQSMTMGEFQSYMNENMNRYKLEDVFKDKLSKLSIDSQNYYNDILVIKCKGGKNGKCKLHANDFVGVHCESCHGELYKVEPQDI